MMMMMIRRRRRRNSILTAKKTVCRQAYCSELCPISHYCR